ncbi:MAG: succinate dehydrogenase/fumarate reductase iron-sulfur subunit [Nitrospinota bacterium]|nr:succinate dehydrogenase/fumarate reductase iron-sulfur subunit [Nitrospinota bacterium]
MSQVTFRIYRFETGKDASPRYQEYKLALQEGDTLLNCLNTIRDTQDGTLAYRMSCGSAICGSCAMRANGHALLACKTQASSLVKNGVIQLDPLGNFPVIRDLVVDLEPFWASLRKVSPWLQPNLADEPVRERLQTPAQFHLIDDVTTCILCASCWSDCNVLEVDKKFLGPATLAKAHRFIFDTRDAKGQERMERIAEPNGVWDCTHCGECSTRCPTETKPLARIEETREAVMKAGITNSPGARHALGFRESMRWFGALNENYLPIRSVGFFNIPGILGVMPVGIRMMLKRKAPPILPHWIDKVGEVRRIFKRFHELRKNNGGTGAKTDGDD